MRRRAWLRVVLTLVGTSPAWLVTTASGQLPPAARFQTRLSTVPIDLRMSATVAGSGTALATLEGTTLTVRGTFEGLKGAATVARLHRSSYIGVAGPAIADLTVSSAAAGTLTGTVTLSANHIDELRKGRLYIQVHSAAAPDGNLRGWLSAQER